MIKSQEEEQPLKSQGEVKRILLEQCKWLILQAHSKTKSFLNLYYLKYSSSEKIDICRKGRISSQASFSFPHNARACVLLFLSFVKVRQINVTPFQSFSDLFLLFAFAYMNLRGNCSLNFEGGK